MSRHEAEALNPDHFVRVGWDPPLQTFFIQVHDSRVPHDEESVVHWQGCGYAELPTIESLAEAGRGYTTVPEQLHLTLQEDKLLNR